MPSISKIRFTNVIYEDGDKRYNDEIFLFDGHNGAILLENGGGKTVFIQTALQAILPHIDLADRKIKKTLKLDSPAHIAIEWIINERPRRYLTTAVTLFLYKNELDSFRYIYEYGENDKHSIENIPFARNNQGKSRSADRGEMQDYYHYMTNQYSMNAKVFSKIKDFKTYIEEQYQIISQEWESIVKINSLEGGVEKFFEDCKTTSQLFDRLLIPTVEDTIIGHNKKDFAETFEKHRASFKEYKQLKEKIEENKEIKNQIEIYANSYQQLYEKEILYTEARKKAKAYMDLLNNQETEINNELEMLKNNQVKLQEKNKLYNLKKDSYEIALEQEKEIKIRGKYNEINNEFEKNSNQLKETNNLYYSIKLAEFKDKLKYEEERHRRNKEKLQQIDKDEDIKDTQSRLKVNSSEIHWNYINKELELENKIEEKEKNVDAIKNKLNNEINNSKNSLREKNNFEKEISNKEIILNKNHYQMNKLKKEILANPEQENVENEKLLWINKRNNYDEENISLTKQNKDLEIEQNGKYKLLELQQEEYQKYSQLKSKIETKIEDFEENHQRLIIKLSELKPVWSNLDSIYLKQETIYKQLNETTTRLDKDREELLYKERIAYRFVDDYNNQDVFYADSFLAEQIDNWKNQFSYIETGIKYIQQLDENKETLFKRYPLWPITLITTTKEKEKLISKVNHISKDIQFPVSILSNEEASKIVNTQKANDEWINPYHWEKNIDNDLFSQWKINIQKQAEESKDKRLTSEEEINNWKAVQNQFIQFINQYSYEDYQEYKDELEKVNNNLFIINSHTKDYKREIDELIEQIKNNSDKISDNKEHINGLSIKIEKATEYLKFKKENDELLEEKLFIQSKLRIIEGKIAQYEKLIEDLNIEKEELKEELLESRFYLNQLNNDNLFREVKEYEPIQNNKSTETLKEERKEIELALQKISKTRNEIVTVIESAINNINDYNKQIEDLRKEHSNLDEELTLPINIQDKMSSLREKISTLEVKETNIREIKDKNKEKLDKLSGQIDKSIKEFNKKYPEEEIYQFKDVLYIVRDSLNKEKLNLEIEEKQLKENELRITKEEKENTSSKNKLEKYDVKHSLNDLTLDKSIISNDEITQFNYKKEKIVEDVITQLEQTYKRVDLEKEQVDKKKEGFKDFCRHNITDVKMREMAIQGVDNKKSYKEVLDYKKHMEIRINTALKYAEQSIRSHNKQLEQFVIHIHTHLKKIADELELIPKKTKIKIDENWKEIYSFTIPEWDEDEGKEDIRDHINWILTQLDKEKYKDQDGKEDTGKIRKDIETWLEAKSLLRVVMRNKMMKVNCRKVTNDNNVTTRSYSWEQSNMWSGGEKWSKNMTLFLGVLNYITEKKQNIKASVKRQGVVLLDNPFGKASSEHVLNPVFFIAEKLGFQIITLTAHAEGKFLRDYFPIIYSCRLRQANDSGKQIMSKEKIIHQAYFQDHDPNSLLRLKEVEQIELF